MLTLYKAEDDNFTRWISEKMERMVVAHQIIDVDQNTDLPDAIDRQNLPVLTDSHERWETKEAISHFLEELHQDLKFSQRMQSDTCHIDPDNPEECL
ncbi:MAG: hypothetical protein U5K69_17640 [Balneolaceae bacterium]|nr:hypothetical protein [Balneolaceae bacterium]